MKLSIIIPVYNVEKYIGRCLLSIYNQGLDLNDFEVIVVNDGTPDNSMNIVEYFSTKYSNLKIINQKNKGQSVARNQGIKNSLGEYIYFIDADDFLVDDCLSRVLFLAENNNLDFCGFNMQGTDNDSLLNDVPINISNIYTGCCFIKKYNYNNGPCWYLIKSKILIDNSIFFIEGRYCEDGIFTLSILFNSMRCSMINAKLYGYFSGNENSTVTRKDNEHLNKMVGDFFFTINYFQGFIENNNVEVCKKRIESRRDSYIFFLFVRLLKYSNDFDLIKHLISKLKVRGLYPIRNFSFKEYPGIKYKLLLTLFNNDFLFKVVIKIRNIIYK